VDVRGQKKKESGEGEQDGRPGGRHDLVRDREEVVVEVLSYVVGSFVGQVL
jgi:hypothetical protein